MSFVVLCDTISITSKQGGLFMEQIFTANLPLSINFIRLVATVLGFAITLSLFLFIFCLIRDIVTKKGSLFTATTFLCFSTGFSTLVAVSLYCLLNLIPHYFFSSTRGILLCVVFFLLSIVVFLLFDGFIDILEHIILNKNNLFASILERLNISDYEGFRYVGRSIRSLQFFYVLLATLSLITSLINIFTGHLWAVFLSFIEFYFVLYPFFKSFLRCGQTAKLVIAPPFLDENDIENNISQFEFYTLTKIKIERLNNILDSLEKEFDNFSKCELEKKYQKEQLDFLQWIYPYFFSCNERNIVGDYCFLSNDVLESEKFEIQESLKILKEASDFIFSNGLKRDMVDAAKALDEGTATEADIFQKYEKDSDFYKIKALADIYNKATALPAKLQKRHFWLFENIIKHTFYYSNSMTDLNRIFAHIYAPKWAIKTICKSSIKHHGKYGVSMDKNDKHLIYIRDAIMNILFHGRYFNKLTLLRRKKELTDIIKALRINTSDENGFLIYDYGIGKITEFDIPLEKRQTIVNATCTLSKVYNELLFELRIRRQIEGYTDFSAPPLRLTKRETDTLRSMIVTTNWAESHILEIKSNVSINGVSKSAKHFNLNEGIIHAILKFDKEFKSHIKWIRDETIRSTDLLQQAWNLIQRGCEYNLELGTVNIPFFPTIKPNERVNLIKLFADEHPPAPPTTVIKSTDNIRIDYSAHFFDERNRKRSKHNAIYGIHKFIPISLKYIYLGSDITKIKITIKHLIHKHNQENSYKFMLSNFTHWLRHFSNL